MSRADSDQWQDICSRGGGRVERQRNQRRDGSCSKAIRHQRLVSFCPPVCGASHLRVHLNDKLAVAKPRDTKPSKNTHPVTHWCGLRLREKYENATVRSSPGNRLMIFRWNISMSDSGGIGRTSWPKCGKALKREKFWPGNNSGGRGRTKFLAVAAAQPHSIKAPQGTYIHTYFTPCGVLQQQCG